MVDNSASPKEIDCEDDGFVQATTTARRNSMHRSKAAQSGRGRGEVRVENGKNRQYKQRQDPFRKKGWSKPSTTATPKSKEESQLPKQNDNPSSLPHTLDPLSEEVSAIVASEFQATSGNTDDAINAALASTAAVAFFASAVAADLDIEDEVDSGSLLPFGETLVDNNGFAAHNDNEPSSKNFASFVQEQSMTELIKDFGAKDEDWNKKAVLIQSTDDDDNAEHGNRTTSSPSSPSSPSSHPLFPSRLAPQGKAPIQVSVISFGYIHGAPSNNTLKDVSWSPYSQPLPALDLRSVTEPVPAYLLFHDGLHSGHVKRVLREQIVATTTTTRNYGDDDDDAKEGKNLKNSYKHFQDYAKRYIAKQWIWPKLIEAVKEGEHGYVNPLSMQLTIGSHLGRHRSVVAVEWVAAELRNLLRKNVNESLAVPVSVSTFHRDVEKKVPANATGSRKRRGDNEEDDNTIDDIKI